MIVFKTNMKELPLNCTDCDLSEDMCKVTLEVLKYKNGRPKYCPLIEVDETINNVDRQQYEAITIDNKEDS